MLNPLLKESNILDNFIERVRSEFHEKETDLIENRMKSITGISFCSELSLLYDHLLNQIYKFIIEDDNLNLCIIATGGYGRRELCIKSDVDIMFLRNEDDDINKVEIIVKEILSILWNLKIDVGHSYRSIQESIKTYQNDFSSFSALLENRFICGNKYIYLQFINRFNSFLDSQKDLYFVYLIIEQMKKRHVKYGNSIKLLEPNVKKSAGGLRDLHNLLWIFNYLDGLIESNQYTLLNNITYNELAMETNTLDRKYNSITFLLSKLYSANLLNIELYEQVLESYSFVLKVRNELHYLENIHSDFLNFKIQKKVSEGLGYNDQNNLGVQRFMRDYYLNTRKIYRLNSLIIEEILDLLNSKTSGTSRRKNLNKYFYIDCNHLCLRIDDNKLFINDTTKIFEAFHYKSKYGVRFDDKIRKYIIDALPSIDENTQKNEKCSKLFLKIFNYTQNIAFTINAMNEIGVLGRFIPEFGQLIALYQFSEYHYFTVDEHTLKAISKLENLNIEQNFFANIFKPIDQKEILFLSVLLHDIGKIFNYKGHEKFGSEISIRVLKRLGYNKHAKVIAFLVENHLEMEKMAFKRNYHDFDTLLDFANLFRSLKRIEPIFLLDCLFLLTYADLSSVNPNSWTEWKGSLLSDLYNKTKDVLKNRSDKFVVLDSLKKEKLSKIEKIKRELYPQILNKTIEEFFNNLLDTRYIFEFDQKEIATHIALLNLGEKISILFRQRNNFTEITLVTVNTKSLLSDFCAVLVINDVNLIDARVFTGENKIVINSFRAVELHNNDILSERQCLKIKSDFYRVLSGDITIIGLLESHKIRWRRKISQYKDISTMARIDFQENKYYSIIDVFGPNILGILYRLTEKFSELKLVIHFARINSYGDGWVGSFYVLDENNNKISSENEFVISSILLSKIEEIIDLELIN